MISFAPRFGINSGPQVGDQVDHLNQVEKGAKATIISPRTPFILKLDSPAATLDRVGGKGASLARLASAGLPVPPGFHITTHAYRHFVAENHLGDAILSAAAQAKTGDTATLDRVSAQIQSLIAQAMISDDIAAEIRQRYGALGSGNRPVAVRSSATAEDLPEMSFAGQHGTYLNVRGADSVLDAVKSCWASLWTARAIGYRARQGIRPEDVSLAVVVQELVPAEVAGILFTANPLTGARDQMMINAAWGLGEAIVGGLVTPDTFVINKQTGAIESQDIGDKELMTVPLAEATREEPVPPEKRKQPALQPQQCAELTRTGAQIEQLYGQPMDIEWAMSDGRIFILQARPITALPEPPVMLEWKLPREKGQYGRSSVIELLPDPLSPLFATLALPLWNEAMIRLARSFGISFIERDRFLLLTINDYAYYYYRFGALQLARMFLVSPGIPGLVRMMRSAHSRWARDARPRYASVIAAWSERDLGATSATELLGAAHQIVTVAADHYLTVQSGILPVAYTTETFFTWLYNKLLKRATDPPALTFLLGFDSAPILAEKSLYDLSSWARTQPDVAGWLERATAEEFGREYSSPSAPIADTGVWSEFKRRFDKHLNQFGHTIYDLDFAKSVPADNPAPLLEALKYFLTGQARNPYERQANARTKREQATQSLLARGKGIRLRLVAALLRAAQRYAPLREDGLADVGLGWPLLRRVLREAGRRLAAAGAIAERDHVFWLQWNEAQAAARALDEGAAPEGYSREVAGRRAKWERERAVTPPVILPLNSRLLGIDITRWMPAQTNQAVGATIKGVGASPGRVAGVARLIPGPGEFSEMRPGDILVAKITTPAWTPLFALAAGVVTDVGGPLSHSSIVAREYHIPAVLGTGVATARIRTGQHITVDGDIGLVTM